jgi:hypothetical protein
LSERVFLLELDFAMANILNYNRETKQHSQTLRAILVVVRVVVDASELKLPSLLSCGWLFWGIV